MNKIRNFINNSKKYGKIGVIRFYLNNLLWGEQVEFNTTKLLKYLIIDIFNPSIKFVTKKINGLRRVALTFINKPKVSVIMSMYNEEAYLEESVESILNQSFKDFEFLIIDDRSEDSSIPIVARYSNFDKRVKVFRNKEHIGLTQSLNILLDKARGEYIARMDADDISLPDRIFKQYDFLESHKDVILIGTGAFNINEKGIILSQSDPLTTPGEVAKRLPIGNCIYHPSIMFRNKKLRYREKFMFSQDYDLYLNLLSLGEKIANVNEPLLKYRINSKSISNQRHKAQELFAQQARKFYVQRKQSKNNEDDYSSFLSQSIFEQEEGK